MNILRILLNLLLALAMCNLCLSQYQDSCAPFNGKGLQNFIKQTVDLIPKNELVQVALNYISDPEIIALKQLITSKKYKNVLDSMMSTEEYKVFEDYMCNKLHIDLNYYRSLISFLIELTPDQIIRSFSRSSKGIEGLMNDFIKLIPRKEFINLYQDLIATDEDLREAVENFKSPELYEVTKSLMNTKSHQELWQLFVDVGAPFDKWYSLLSKVLNWPDRLSIIS